jgi:hypothetical protein
LVSTIWEAWQDPTDNSIMLAPAVTIPETRSSGLLSPQALCLYRFTATTHEEAHAIHALRMGWAPYRPVGSPVPCPRCGSTYYPEGSGQCWKCSDQAGPAPEPLWSVWRQDDNGNRFEMARGVSQAEATMLVRTYEDRPHKQTYWITLTK